MKISKLISSLLIAVSCFCLHAKLFAYEPDIKIKPVFMNGMGNTKREAKKSATLITKRLQKLYGSDIIKSQHDFYLAYNKSERGYEELSQVVRQFLYNLRFNKSVKYTDAEIDEYLTEYKQAALNNLDVDSLKHQTSILRLLGDEYKLIITAHSQGNMYFNLLYDGVLQYYPDDYRLVSLASPVVINAPKSNMTMIIEKSDIIKYLNGLREYSSNISNANNSSFTGHSFKGYLDGNNTSSMMNRAYKKYLSELYPEDSYNDSDDIDDNEIIVDNFIINSTLTSNHNNVQLHVTEQIYSLIDNTGANMLLRESNISGVKGNNYSLEYSELEREVRESGGFALEYIILTFSGSIVDCRYDNDGFPIYPNIEFEIKTPIDINGGTGLKFSKEFVGGVLGYLFIGPEYKKIYDDNGNYTLIVTGYTFESIDARDFNVDTLKLK